MTIHSKKGQHVPSPESGRLLPSPVTGISFQLCHGLLPNNGTQNRHSRALLHEARRIPQIRLPRPGPLLTENESEAPESHAKVPAGPVPAPSSQLLPHQAPGSQAPGPTAQGLGRAVSGRQVISGHRG